LEPSNAQVVIGQDFFKKEARDYTIPALAIVREFCQNASDAKATQIYFELTPLDDDRTVIYCANNGAPFPLAQIQDRFMQLGQSSKTLNDSSVGAFGKAKVILCFANEEYAIRGSDCLIAGAGGNYRIYTDKPSFLVAETGLAATAVMQSTHECDVRRNWEHVTAFSTVAAYGHESLLRWIRWMATHAGKGFDTTVYVAPYGEHRLGELRRYENRLPHKRWSHKEFGRVKRYAGDNMYGGQLVVRYRGVPMFQERLSGKKDYVIVELKQASSLGELPLTANRDGLKYPYGAELRDFVDDLYTNAIKAIPAAKDEMFVLGDKALSMGLIGNRYLGRPSRQKKDSAAAADEVKTPTHAERYTELPTVQEPPEVVSTDPTTSPVSTEDRPWVMGVDRASTWQKYQPDDATSHLVMRNMTPYTVPGKYDVRSHKLSKAALTLLVDWVNVLSVVHSVMDQGMPRVQVGFVFSKEAVGMFHTRSQMPAVLINPVAAGDLEDRSILRSRFDWVGPKSRSRLLSVAAHEYLHAVGIGSHDEHYAAMLTHTLGELWDAQTWIKRELQQRRPSTHELVVQSWQATIKLWEGTTKCGVKLGSR